MTNAMNNELNERFKAFKIQVPEQVILDLNDFSCDQINSFNPFFRDQWVRHLSIAAEMISNDILTDQGGSKIIIFKIKII